MTRRFLTLAAAGLAATGSALSGQSAGAEPFALGTIVVSADTVPTDATKVGATVDVIDSRQLADAANSTVAAALRSVPGFSLRSRGGMGQQASFSIRGASQNYVDVLVDGIDVTDPSGTQVAYDFGHLGTASVSRIEVLKGSQSALYGSSAVGGVVAIQTRHATEPGLHQYSWIEAGTRKTLNGSYTLTYKDDATDYALTLSHMGTSGYPVWVGDYATGKDNGYYANRISANAAHTFANGVKLGFAAFAQADHGTYYPGTYTVMYAPNAEASYKSDTGGLRVYGEFETGALKNTLSAQTFRIQRHYVVTPAGVGADYTYTGKRNKLAYKGEATLGDKARLVFGADTTLETYDQKGSYGAQHSNRRISGVYADLAYALTDELTVTGAARRDHDSRFGGENTWRLSAAWNPRSDVTVRASLGTGYRAPSNYELFSPYGNTGLQPEKSRSLDLGIEKRFAGKSYLRATYFHLSADNLIGYDYSSTACGSGYGCYAQVPGRSVRQGVELEGAAEIGRATLTGSYTYTDSSITSESWAIPPRHMVSLDLSAPLTAKLTGGLTLTGGADRKTLPNFATLDARLSYAIDARTEAYLRVEHLTDTSYQLVEDYAQPGRTLYVGLRKSF
ncbi:TonB-dependent receptor plug domain-containing protein [Acidimangrovimonas sediminis]|uniref:TonB-dependent receptor plug domain-containing protein n=1 Tax=Acidimangrovimonas sediminis TaxID=2056283 RepID=UPI000C7FCA99|nr:TonB-dependent receptor [Acidimangrovimonas sediminis]